MLARASEDHVLTMRGDPVAIATLARTCGVISHIVPFSLRSGAPNLSSGPDSMLTSRRAWRKLLPPPPIFGDREVFRLMKAPPLCGKRRRAVFRMSRRSNQACVPRRTPRRIPGSPVTRPTSPASCGPASTTSLPSVRARRGRRLRYRRSWRSCKKLTRVSHAVISRRRRRAWCGHSSTPRPVAEVFLAGTEPTELASPRLTEKRPRWWPF